MKSSLPICASVVWWLNIVHITIVKWITLWTLLLWRIGSYTVDFGFDLALIVEYAVKGHWWYFSLTFLFVFVPAAITSYLNWKYYAEKWEIKRKIEKSRDEFNLREKLIIDPDWKFYLRRLFYFMLISPIIRYTECITLL